MTKAMHNTKPLHVRGCLFCLRSDGGFLSEEHIFSEALGNYREHVLPSGVVCDRCNNGPLALADEELVNFPPITLLRAERGIPTKAGKPVMSKWGNVRIVYPERGTLEAIGPSKDVVRGMRRFDPANGVPGTLNLQTGWRLTEDRIGRMVRSVWKSTIEFVYLDRGPEVAFARMFDHARRAVIDPSSHGWVLVPKERSATESVELAYEWRKVFGRIALPTMLSVFGVVFMTDPLLWDYNTLDIETPTPTNVWTF